MKYLSHGWRSFAVGTLGLVLLSVGCARLANNSSTFDPNALKAGDPAPPLSLDTFVTGEPLSAELDDKVHVIEFWATWCPPCRDSMPHLSGLQTQYQNDAVFVGITDETAAKVESFLESSSPGGVPWSEVVTYRLATDAGNQTFSAYMEAAGQSGIPTAFIVDRDGIIRWIGHPLDIDAPLSRIVSEQKPVREQELGQAT